MENKIRDFRDLIVWQKGHELAMMIYKVTKTFPQEERYGLVSQMRRASVSIPANIAEGFEKRGRKDKINFHNIAQGSLGELKYYIIISRELGYHNQYDTLWRQASEVSRLLAALIRSIENAGLKGKDHG
jgi:four helix bundle protein